MDFVHFRTKRIVSSRKFLERTEKKRKVLETFFKSFTRFLFESIFPSLSYRARVRNAAWIGLGNLFRTKEFLSRGGRWPSWRRPHPLTPFRSSFPQFATKWPGHSVSCHLCLSSPNALVCVVFPFLFSKKERRSLT